MEFKDRLSGLMRQYGYNGKRLHEMTGVSESMISDMKRGKVVSPGMDTLKKLAPAFGLTVPELLGFDEVVSQNIKRLMGEMSVEEFTGDIKNKTDFYIEPETMWQYLRAEKLPSRAVLELLADYADLESADCFYTDTTLPMDSMTKSVEKSEFVKFAADSENFEYMRLAMDIKKNKLNIDAIRAVLFRE